MPTVQQLYELWADDSQLREALKRSLEPRGLDSLYEAFAALGPRPGELLLDAGAANAKHAIRLVQELGLRAIALEPLEVHRGLARAAIAEAGLDDEIDLVDGSIESIPLAADAVDWIWCRDVLVHVDAGPGLAELARVLRPGGALLAYVTLATDRLEPRERAELVGAMAIRTFDAETLEQAAADAGFTLRSVDRLGSEWRERMVEDETWDAGDDLLEIARLRRGGYAGAEADAVWGGLVWGVYQMLGKLCPTVYVWTCST